MRSLQHSVSLGVRHCRWLYRFSRYLIRGIISIVKSDQQRNLISRGKLDPVSQKTLAMSKDVIQCNSSHNFDSMGIR